jgi:hypothetical protein
MTGLLETRLGNQRLNAGATVNGDLRPLVAWMGAVQAQDYVGAAWALALRTRGLTLEAVDRAFAAGEILRTHILRPTWHFVAPADIVWLLELTGPRVKTLLRTRDHRLALDTRVYTRSRSIIERALEGGRQLTRSELAGALRKNRIEAAGQRLAHIVMHAELEGVICSGARRGVQFTYGLVAERAPGARTLPREEALATLATRYFQSHGPATIKDFAWWSGLTMADARAGVESAKVQSQVLKAPPPLGCARGAHYLLPNYDEYLIAYRDRGGFLDPARPSLVLGPAMEYPHQVVLDGRVAGSWRRTMTKASARVALRLYARPSRPQAAALAAQANLLGTFLGVPCAIDA